MAVNSFKNLPDTSTPLSAENLNRLINKEYFSFKASTSNINISKSGTYGFTEIPFSYTSPISKGNSFYLSGNKLYARNHCVVRASANLTHDQANGYAVFGVNGVYGQVIGSSDTHLVGYSCTMSDIFEMKPGDYITLGLGSPAAYTNATIYSYTSVLIDVLEYLD